MAPKLMATLYWRLVVLKWGVCQLPSIARLLLMNAGCCITFLQLNYILLGLVGDL